MTKGPGSELGWAGERCRRAGCWKGHGDSLSVQGGCGVAGTGAHNVAWHQQARLCPLHFSS